MLHTNHKRRDGGVTRKGSLGSMLRHPMRAPEGSGGTRVGPWVTDVGHHSTTGSGLKIHAASWPTTVLHLASAVEPTLQGHRQRPAIDKHYHFGCGVAHGAPFPQFCLCTLPCWHFSDVQWARAACRVRKPFFLLLVGFFPFVRRVIFLRAVVARWAGEPCISIGNEAVYLTPQRHRQGTDL